MWQQLKQFLLRWVVCSSGLWIASLITPTIEFNGDTVRVIIIAGLILALINAVLKPLVIVLSLPAIMLSLGLFTVVINGFMVFVASWLYAPLDVETFGAAVLTGIIIGLLNFILTKLLEGRGEKLHAKRV